MTPPDPVPEERPRQRDRSGTTWVPDEQESQTNLPLNEPDPDEFDDPEGEGEGEGEEGRAAGRSHVELSDETGDPPDCRRVGTLLRRGLLSHCAIAQPSCYPGAPRGDVHAGDADAWQPDDVASAHIDAGG